MIKVANQLLLSYEVYADIAMPIALFSSYRWRLDVLTFLIKGFDIFVNISKGTIFFSENP